MTYKRVNDHQVDEYGYDHDYYGVDDHYHRMQVTIKINKSRRNQTGGQEMKSWIGRILRGETFLCPPLRLGGIHSFGDYSSQKELMMMTMMSTS